MWVRSPWSVQIPDGTYDMKIGNIIKCEKNEILNESSFLCDDDDEKNGDIFKKNNSDKKEEKKGGKYDTSIKCKERINTKENIADIQNIDDIQNTALSKRDRLVGVSCPLSYYLDDSSCVCVRENNLCDVHLSDFIDSSDCTNVRFIVSTTSTDNVYQKNREDENSNENKYSEKEMDIENAKYLTKIENDNAVNNINVSTLNNDKLCENKMNKKNTKDVEIKNKSENKNISENKNGNENEKSISVPWILDICLDYFSTLNPFLPELELNVKKDIENFSEKENRELTSETIIQIILHSFKYMKFRNTESDKLYAINNSNCQLKSNSLNDGDNHDKNKILLNLNEQSG